MTAPTLHRYAAGRVDPALLEQIAEEVVLVEQELSAHVRSRVQMLDRVGRMTLEAGGKRLRPAFVGIAAQATGLPYDSARTRSLGAALEMIHMATLIHDDVIDNAATRRGRPTAASEYGNAGAILAGDALLARAMQILSRDGDVELVRVVAEAVVDVAQGEVRELEARGDFDLVEEEHLEVLRMKTASFIECCCEIGGMAAGADATARRALKFYGHHIGMAFQIVDDLLDYRGDHAKTGKPRATDFREGQATLPLIFLRDELSDSERAAVRHQFGNHPGDDEIRLLAQWMEARGAFARADALARSHIDRALEAIEDLPPTASRELLATMAEYIFVRES